MSGYVRRSHSDARSTGIEYDSELRMSPSFGSWPLLILLATSSSRELAD